MAIPVWLGAGAMGPGQDTWEFQEPRPELMVCNQPRRREGAVRTSRGCGEMPAICAARAPHSRCPT